MLKQKLEKFNLYTSMVLTPAVWFFFMLFCRFNFARIVTNVMVFGFGGIWVVKVFRGRMK